MLNAVPFVNHDLEYVTAINTALVISNTADGVLDNDFDVEGSTLTATKVADPANGTITLSSNGTFTYTPDNGFEGFDTFTYDISDGTNTSVEAIVQVTVGDGMSGSLNLDQRGTSLLNDGVLSISQPVGSGLELTYSSDSIPTVLIPIETLIATGTTIPDSITANLTIDSVSSGDVTFDNTGLATGEPLRFSLRSLTTSSPTGMYDWSVVATLNYSGSTLTRTFTGTHAIVNRSTSEFGSGWWLDGLDRIYDQAGGALLVNGDGTTLWFEKNGSTYEAAAGDLTFSTLVENGGGDFTLTDKWGDERNFDSSGYLTDIQALNNSSARFTFAYDGSNRVETITDEFNRDFDFTYDGNGKISSINDFYGRDSSFTVASGNLLDITLTDETASGYTAPEWSFGYITIGSQDYLDEVTDPASQTTGYLYDTATRRLRQIDYPDASNWKLYPTIGQGYAAGTGNTMLKVADMNARYTDEEANTFDFATDRFGSITSFTDATDEVTTYDYDEQGLLYRITEADPDGGGSQTSPVTEFGYNVSGDLVITEFPDDETTTAAYHSTLHRVTTFTNELGNSVTYTYFTDGDLDTFTDLAGNDWSYTYDTHGNLSTETTPDPDGAGTDYSEITTTYTYDATYYNRLIKITWDNSDFQEFTFTSSDQIDVFTDELGNETDYDYDLLDQLIKVRLPDPDGGGGLASPEYEYTYTSTFQLDTETDPLGNVTDYDYNSRGRLTKVKLEDPDGAGSLTSPEYVYTYDDTGNLLTETRPEFNAVSISHAYDANGRLTESSGPITSQDTTYTYDNIGRLITLEDASGRIVNYEYDSRSRLVKFIDHDPDGGGAEVGPTTEYEYDDAGRLTNITDPLGRETTATYFTSGLLSKVTRPDPDGVGDGEAPVTEYTYDDIGRRYKITDAADRVSEFQFNIFGQVTKFIDVDPDDTGPLASPETDYTYNDAGWLTSVTDPSNFATSYAYDNLGRRLSVTLPDPDGAGGKTSPVYSTTYDAVGNVLTETDALSNVTTYAYDDLYRQLTVTMPDPDAAGALTSPVWTYEYNDDMLLDTLTDPMGHDTTYGYDTAGRLTSTTDPLSNVTSFTLDLLNRITDITEPDPDGGGGLAASVTSYTFDMYSRLVETEDANNEIVSQTYDAAGQLTSLTDQSGNVTYWAYDGLGRLSMETDELGYTESSYYNVLDRLIAKVDRESRTTLFGFDGHKTQEFWYEHASSTTPLATVATTTEGTTGVNEVQTVTMTDATSGGFRLAFDGEMTDPLAYNASAATVETALESLNGIDNVSVSLASSVYTVTFLGDLAATNVSPLQGDVRLDSDGTESSKITFTYDDAFRLIEIDDSWADYTYTLDNLGRVTETTEDITGFSTNIYLDFDHDANSNRTSMSAEIGSGMFGEKDYANTFSFDNLNRLIQVSQTNQSGGNSVADKSVKFTYNNLSQLTYVERYENTSGTGDALRTAYTYDTGNRMASLKHRDVDGGGGSSQLAEYVYTYDAMGRITEIDSSQDGVSDYTYDALRQLTDADHDTGRTDESYTFDETGNRTGGDYVVSAKNRTDESTGYEYEYDRNGNRTKRLDTSDDSYELFSYDHRNRLTNVDYYNSSDVLQKTIEYSYDAYNRMVRREFDSDGPGGSAATDQFFAGYDGIHATLEFDDSGQNDVSHRYLWGVQADQLLADEQVSTVSSDGDIHWTLGDQVGTIRDIGEYDSGNSEFEITNHREYDSFGNLISETDISVDVSFGFTGKWTDSETGYTHHLNRWFDPVIGKWLSEDPIGFEAGDTNILRYVANQVTSKIDSSGLELGVVQAVETLGGPSDNQEKKRTQDDEKKKANKDEVLIGPVVIVGDPIDRKPVKEIWDKIVDLANEDNDGDNKPDNPKLNGLIEKIKAGKTKVTINVGSRVPGVDGGSHSLSTIDVFDLGRFPDGPGPKTSKERLILHEVIEQIEKQTNPADHDRNPTTHFWNNHIKAIELEAALDGWTREITNWPDRQPPPDADEFGTTTLIQVFRKPGEKPVTEVINIDRDGVITFRYPDSKK